MTIVLLALLLFVLSIFMERRTPSTSQVHVQAYIVGIAPEVTGRVVEVNVNDNSPVEANQVLFRIDPTRYQIAVRPQQIELRPFECGERFGRQDGSGDRTANDPNRYRLGQGGATFSRSAGHERG